MRISSVGAWTGIILGSVLLSGCAGWFPPPDEFATQTSANYEKFGEKDYSRIVRDVRFDRSLAAADKEKPIPECETKRGKDKAECIRLNPDFVKPDFVVVLQELCPAEILDKIKTPVADRYCGEELTMRPSGSGSDDPGKSLDSTSYRCWAYKHPVARVCAESVARHAIDQCAVKSGMQNAFAAKANLSLGLITAMSSLAVDGALATSGGNDKTVAALATGAVVSGAGNAGKFIPSSASPLPQTLISAQQSYSIIGDYADSDVSCINDVNCKQRKQVLLRYARLHDVIYAACPVGAY